MSPIVVLCFATQICIGPSVRFCRFPALEVCAKLFISGAHTLPRAWAASVHKMIVPLHWLRPLPLEAEAAKEITAQHALQLLFMAARELGQTPDQVPI